MTNELEKQFFDTFGIEPRGKKCTCDVKDFAKCTTYYCTSCEKALKKDYPQITDRILLELICILNPYCYSGGENIQHLKESVLEWCIKYKEDIKHQVRTLFEEG